MKIIAITQRSLLLLALIFSLSAVAETSKNPDPFEGFNRKVFAFNEFADRWVLKPVATGYRWVTPDVVDKGVSNVFSNLGEVTTMVNNVCQAKFANAGTDLGRFLINSTIGIVGIFDVASKMGLEKNDEDFGQTLAVWGVGDGPYLVLPFFGPSNLRDAFGRIPDVYTSPVSYVEDVPVRNTLRGVDIVDVRADLIDSEGLITGDRYSFIREVYRQNRDYKVNDGEVEDDFGDDFGDDDFGDDDF